MVVKSRKGKDNKSTDKLKELDLSLSVFASLCLRQKAAGGSGNLLVPRRNRRQDKIKYISRDWPRFFKQFIRRHKHLFSMY